LLAFVFASVQPTHPNHAKQLNEYHYQK